MVNYGTPLCLLSFRSLPPLSLTSLPSPPTSTPLMQNRFGRQQYGLTFTLHTNFSQSHWETLRYLLLHSTLSPKLIFISSFFFLYHYNIVNIYLDWPRLMSHRVICMTYPSRKGTSSSFNLFIRNFIHGLYLSLLFFSLLPLFRIAFSPNSPSSVFL